MNNFTAKPEHTYGLIVGVERYQESRWNVNGPVHDALELARWLCERGVPKENLKLCLSPLEQIEPCGFKIEAATEQNLSDIIENYLTQIQGDLLYIFWAGHGVINSQRNRKLLCADATKRNWRNLDFNSLLLLLLSDWVKIRNHICFVDACANYVLESEGRPTNLKGKEFSSGKPRTDSQQFILLATREGEKAKVRNQGKTGYFSQAVREALTEEFNDRWPPNMEAITEKVKQKFEGSDKKQLPTYLFYQGWDGDKKDYYFNQLESPHNLPRSGVIQFVGRDEALQRLHQQLQQTERIAISAVTGMRGAGKTELALQYALHHQQLLTYPGGLCWIQAGEADVATQIVRFARIQLNLQLPDGLDLAEQVAYCWRNWQAGEVLLVLDDVQDYQQVKPYLPPPDLRFKIVVTTRRQDLAESFKILRLPVLTEEAAVELLVLFVGEEYIQSERDQTEQLCKELGYLPLALELVGRYLKRKPDLSVAQMRQRLSLEHRSLRVPSVEMTEQYGVAAAFELSWKELDEPAQRLGCLLSLFALAPIPWSLVEQCLPNQDEEALEDVRDEQLVNLSLLERAGRETYQLHQLIRECFGSKLKELAAVDTLKQGFCKAMVAAAQQVPETLTLSEIVTVAPSIPHIAESVKHQNNGLSDEEFLHPFASLGRFYQGQGAYSQAELWYKQCLVVARERLGQEHFLVASSLNNLAFFYSSQGRYPEAEPLYLLALKLRKRLLGTEHPDVAISLNNLAHLYSSQGRYAEAEPLYEQALELWKRQLGTEHPNVATSLNNLAALYSDQGRYTKAEPLYLQALKMRKHQLGTEHPDVALGLNNLAGLYSNQGRYAEAEPLYLQALEMRRRLLGTEHPNVASSVNNLANLYKSQGRYAEAEPLSLQALEMRKRLLGTEHPDVATSLNNLASLYSSQERYAAAEPLYLQALKLRKRQLGTEHPDIALGLNNLAFVYSSQGRYAEAEPLYLQALKLRKRLLGTEHPDIAISLNNLALLYYSQGRYAEAEPLYLQALKLSKRLLGTEHPNVALGLNNLALVYSSQGRYAEAEPLYLQALKLSKRLLGTEHPDVASSLNNLAYFYYSQGRYTAAEPLYLQVLELRKRLLGEEHADVASSLNNLALIYKFQGRYAKAEPLYLQVLELRKRLLGEEHPDVATSLNNLAGVYDSQGRYTEAELLYLQALELSKRLLGEEHPDVATSLNNLAGVYDSQGRYTEAEPLYLQALELSKRLLGEEHPNVAQILNNLAALHYSQGRYTAAEPLYLQALEMRKRLLGEEHPDVVQSLNNLAVLYYSQERWAEAEPLYQQALEIAEPLLGIDHPYTVTIHKMLQSLERSTS